MIKARTIKLQKYQYNYPGNPTPPPIQFEDRQAIVEDDYEEFKKRYEGKKCLGKMTEGKKVMFDKSVTFPKKKFKDAFPTNKLVYKVDEADIMIVDTDNIKRSGIYKVWFQSYYEDPVLPDHYLSSTASPATPSARFCIYDVENLEKGINRIYEILPKEWMDVRDLALPSENVIDEENYRRLDKMLSASDGEMVHMAMNMLTAYDYMKDRTRIVMLLTKNWANWQRFGGRKVNIELKSLLRKITLDYGAIGWGTNDSNTFWFRMILDNQDDPIIVEGFNKWVNKHVKSDQQLILTPVSKLK